MLSSIGTDGFLATVLLTSNRVAFTHPLSAGPAPAGLLRALGRPLFCMSPPWMPGVVVVAGDTSMLVVLELPVTAASTFSVIDLSPQVPRGGLGGYALDEEDRSALFSGPEAVIKVSLPSGTVTGVIPTAPGMRAVSVTVLGAGTIYKRIAVGLAGRPGGGASGGSLGLLSRDMSRLERVIALPVTVPFMLLPGVSKYSPAGDSHPLTVIGDLGAVVVNVGWTNASIPEIQAYAFAAPGLPLSSPGCDGMPSGDAGFSGSVAGVAVLAGGVEWQMWDPVKPALLGAFATVPRGGVVNGTRHGCVALNGLYYLASSFEDDGIDGVARSPPFSGNSSSVTPTPALTLCPSSSLELALIITTAVSLTVAISMAALVCVVRAKSLAEDVELNITSSPPKRKHQISKEPATERAAQVKERLLERDHDGASSQF